MRFDVVGSKKGPVVVMLTGSFCPGECLDYLYNRMMDLHIIVVTYNGHYKGSKDYTTRQQEAAEICDYLQTQGIHDIRMIYGQSMGAEVGMELYWQLTAQGIQVRNLFWDGAPMIRLSPAYKAFMRFKFSKMMAMCRNHTADDILNMGLVKNIVGDKKEALRPMVEACCKAAPYLTETSIRNVNECCYTFDYPPLSEEMQHHTTFLYGDNEKAYKTCYKAVIQHYPHANYRIIPGQGHCTWSCMHTDEYIAILRGIIDAPIAESVG